MPWDTFFTIVLYFAQGALAILGIWVSLKPQPHERHKLLILAFIITLIVAVASGTGLHVLNKRNSENEQKIHKAEIDKIGKDLLQSRLSLEFVKGQLNATALLIGKSGDKMSLAIEKLAQSTTQTTNATNKQICSNTVDLVQKMNKFEHNRELASRNLSEHEAVAMQSAKTDSDRHHIWQQFTGQMMRQNDLDQYEFRTTLLGEAIYTKDELLKRLPPQSKPDPTYLQVQSVFEGSLAGAYPVYGAAAYLESLSRKLCP